VLMKQLHTTSPACYQLVAQPVGKAKLEGKGLFFASLLDRDLGQTFSCTSVYCLYNTRFAIMGEVI